MANIKIPGIVIPKKEVYIEDIARGEATAPKPVGGDTDPDNIYQFHHLAKQKAKLNKVINQKIEVIDDVLLIDDVPKDIGSKLVLPDDKYLNRYWSFDEGSGDRLHEYCGRTLDEIMNAPSWDQGISGKCLVFAGTNYVKIVSVSDTGAKAVSIWFTASSFPTEGNRHTLIALIGTLTIGLIMQDSKLCVYGKYASGSKMADVTGLITLNEWNHLVVNYDSADVPSYMLNNTNITTTVNQTATISSYRNAIGACYSSDEWRGKIDEVRQYSEALTEDEQSGLFLLPGGNKPYVPNDTDVNLKARANHTGTQLASTISDFQASVSANDDVDANKTKLSGIEAGATADQSDAEIKTAYENNTDTNVFLDNEKSKLTGIDENAQKNITYVARANYDIDGSARTDFVAMCKVNDDGSYDHSMSAIYMQYLGLKQAVDASNSSDISLKEEINCYIGTAIAAGQLFTVNSIEQPHAAIKKVGDSWYYFNSVSWIEMTDLSYRFIIGYMYTNSSGDLTNTQLYSRAYHFKEVPQIQASKTELHATNKHIIIDGIEKTDLQAGDTDNIAGVDSEDFKDNLNDGKTPDGNKYFDIIRTRFEYEPKTEQEHGADCPTGSGSTYNYTQKGILLQIKSPIMFKNIKYNYEHTADTTVTKFTIQKYNAAHSALETIYEHTFTLLTGANEYTVRNLFATSAEPDIYLEPGDYYLSIKGDSGKVSFAETTDSAQTYANTYNVAIQGNATGLLPNWSTLWDTAGSNWYYIFDLKFEILNVCLALGHLDITSALAAERLLDGANYSYMKSGVPSRVQKVDATTYFIDLA